MAAAGGSRLSYIPEAHEKGYYEGLFAVADTQRTGSLGGGQAVQFFSRSGLPPDVLKSVWTLADQPTTSSLDLPKFAVAVRLIQLLQNGHKGQGPQLQAPAGVVLRPAQFEGVSGVLVPLPPPAGPVAGAGGAAPIPPVPQVGPPQQLQPPQRAPYQPQQPPAQYQPQSQPMQQPMQPPMQQPLQQPVQQLAPQTPPRHPQPVAAASVPVLAPASRPPSSLALTPQDPYTLTPSEQARYETMYSDYCDPDGFVHGSRAVELFTKSGLSQPQLAAIWRMVDQPVDNKLDKLEFAMAMHLIVCVSKRNLPLPPGLPLSLKQLKAQQEAAAASMPPPATMQVPAVMAPSPTIPEPPHMGHGLMDPESMHRPQPMVAVPSHQQQQQMTMPPPIMPSSSASVGGGSLGGLSGLPGPPPLQNAGGVSISDAFEGLDDGASSYMGSVAASKTTSGPPPIQPSMTFETHGSGVPVLSRALEPMQVMPHAEEPAPAPVPVTKSTQQLASSYAMGETPEELKKMRTVLQKLQAENISLKAQLNNLTEEERDAAKELHATVDEIGKLSTQLTGLRSDVLSAKNHLLEMTAELKAAQERKGAMVDLIAETAATKQAIDEAIDGIEASKRARDAPPAPAPVVVGFDGDLFGLDPVPGPSVTNPPAGPDMTGFAQPPAAPDLVGFGAPPNMAARDAPGIAPATSSQGPPPPPAPKSQEPAYQMHAAPPMDFGQPTLSGESHPLDEVDEDHGYGFGGVMGGAPSKAPLPTPSYSSMAPANSRQTTFSANPYGNQNSSGASAPTVQEVETLKRRAKEAEDLARDAEGTLHQLTSQADELRRAADQAEKMARDAASQAEGGKRKGFMGRGKKKDAKDAERLSQDAKAKKDQFLQVQSQVNDARAFAAEAKHEADKLRREAEEAEISAASAASMESSSPKSNGYQSQIVPSTATVPAYGGGLSTTGGFGGQPLGGYSGGYDSHVMGSGGLSIPDPDTDPYSNPF